jgi:hypothetical protein
MTTTGTSFCLRLDIAAVTVEKIKIMRIIHCVATKDIIIIIIIIID